MAADHQHKCKAVVSTPPQPNLMPLFSRPKVRLSRRTTLALVCVVAFLMVLALFIPVLAIALILVFLACAAFILGCYVVYWFRHRPLQRRYDKKGNLYPNIVEGVAAYFAALWPLMFGNRLGIPSLWLALVLTFINSAIVLVVLICWWLPAKNKRIDRAASQRAYSAED